MKKLFLTLTVTALAFTSCGDSDGTGDSTPRELRIAAISVIGSGSSDLTEVIALTLPYGDEIARASVANGGFTMILPVTPAAEVLETALSFISVDINYDEIRISDPLASYFVVEFIGYDNDGSIGTLENQSSFGTSTIEYWYVDREVTIMGSSEDGSTNYNVKLGQGWNPVLVHMDINGTSHTSPLPERTDLGWIFYPFFNKHS